MGHIGDGEWVRRRQRLHAASFCNLLIGDHARNRSGNFDNSRRMIQVRSEQTQMLSSGRRIDFGVFERGLSPDLGVIRNLEGALRNSPVIVQVMGALLLDLRQVFVVDSKLLVLDSFLIIGIGAGDIRAPDLEQELALLHFGAKPDRFRLVAPRPVKAPEPGGTHRGSRHRSRLTLA